MAADKFRCYSWMGGYPAFGASSGEVKGHGNDTYGEYEWLTLFVNWYILIHFPCFCNYTLGNHAESRGSGTLWWVVD